MDTKLLVDVATGVMDEWNMLDEYDEEATERFCKALHKTFDSVVAEQAPASAAPTRGNRMAEHYENGPAGMPRVERMTDSTIDWVINGVDTGYIFLEEKGYPQMRNIAHAVAEEVLARLPAWPSQRTATAVQMPEADGTMLQNSGPGGRTVEVDGWDSDSMQAYREAGAEEARREGAEQAAKIAEGHTRTMVRRAIRDTERKYAAQRAADDYVIIADRPMSPEQVHAALDAAQRAAGGDAVPYEAIGKILNEVMAQASANGANSVSMPDEYVSVAHFLAYPEKYAAQLVAEAAAQADDERTLIAELREKLVAAPTAQSTLPDDERAAFEKWANSEGKDDRDLERCSEYATTVTGDDYCWKDVEGAWKAWQARAALRQPGALPDEAEDAALEFAIALDQYGFGADAYECLACSAPGEYRGLGIPHKADCVVGKAGAYVAAKQAGKEFGYE